jgi:hypothetical protein
MIDKWFLNDINEVLEHHNRLVITDALGEGEFLLEYLPPTVTRIDVESNDLSEIDARYRAETEHREDNVVFYTKQMKGQLKFLLEYAETNGCIVLDDMEQYIKTHLFDETHENTELSKTELLMAAKLSKGKDLKWWKGVCNRIIPPMDTDKLIIDLLSNPADTKKNTDIDIWNVLVKEVYAVIDKPQTEQPVEVMAQTIMDAIFKGLLNNHISSKLLNIYYKCIDSTPMKKRMEQYIGAFNIPKDASPLKAHPDHCFVELDKKIFRMLSKTLEDDGFIENYLQAVSLRIKRENSYKATWLKDVKTILDFKNKKLNEITSIDDFTIYYKDVFAPLDSAIRHLYAEWLNEENILRPYQYLYEQYNKELLGKWFTLTKQYIPSQKNVIRYEFASTGRTAIIVCDGLRLEIAETIVQNVKFHNNRKTAYAMLPSVTENGMSALFGCNKVELDANKRYQHLQEELPDIQIIQLEKLNNSITASKLVLLFGDIDQVGEKKQLAALKDINAYEELLTKKIKELFSMGYHKVVLMTDHGFVITGILDEADKVVAPKGADKVEERFCTATERLATESLIERQFDFNNSSYQYFAKTDKPFRTKGCYGYSHGGFTPQECIIPVYEFTQDKALEMLEISISNKNALKEVTGNHFTVKLKAGGNKDSFYLDERRIIVEFYDQDKLLTSIPTFKMKHDETQEFEYDMPASGKIKVVVVDAETKKQIDYCSIEKFDARGLDGLL